MEISDRLISIAGSELEFIQWMAYFMIGNGLLVILCLTVLKSPYGRYASSNWGPSINARLAWLIQELPAIVAPIYCMLYLPANQSKEPANILLLALLCGHYFQRALIYPLLIKGGKPTPLIPFMLAFIFCLYNGYMQGRYLSHYAVYPKHWMSSPNYIGGIVLFLCGMTINIHSDHILRNLRRPGETGYKIPRGGFFEFVSGANFFGECLEWWGFALACWSLPAFAFAFFTTSNIGPRAIHHHQWYQQKFKEDYPSNRKALIPFLL